MTLKQNWDTKKVVVEKDSCSSIAKGYRQTNLQLTIKKLHLVISASKKKENALLKKTFRIGAFLFTCSKRR